MDHATDFISDQKCPRCGGDIKATIVSFRPMFTVRAWCENAPQCQFGLTSTVSPRWHAERMIAAGKAGDIAPRGRVR